MLNPLPRVVEVAVEPHILHAKCLGRTLGVARDTTKARLIRSISKPEFPPLKRMLGGGVVEDLVVGAGPSMEAVAHHAVRGFPR